MVLEITSQVEHGESLDLYHVEHDDRQWCRPMPREKRCLDHAYFASGLLLLSHVSLMP